uniref:Uncharacterized protein n=1 Tax=Janibacter limosus TaxID=53458 RepID=A0AC61U0G1_9MICO|nr:hypothetical protein [Janibacter limosus]
MLVGDARRAVGQLADEQRDGEADTGDEAHADDVRPAQRLVQLEGGQATEQEGRQRDPDGLAEEEAGDDPEGDRVLHRGAHPVHAADGHTCGEEGEDGHGDERGEDAPLVGRVGRHTVVDRSAVRIGRGLHPGALGGDHRDREAREHTGDGRVDARRMDESPVSTPKGTSTHHEMMPRWVARAKRASGTMAGSSHCSCRPSV